MSIYKDFVIIVIASGSSAGMSDQEIQNLRGPEINRGSGKPRSKRYISPSEKGNKRKAKRVCVATNSVKQKTAVMGSPAGGKGKAVKTKQIKKKAQTLRELQGEPQNLAGSVLYNILPVLSECLFQFRPSTAN